MTTPIFDIPFDSEQDYRVFLLDHAEIHDRIYAAIIDAGKSMLKFPLTDAAFPNDTDWLNNHQLEHQQMFDILGLSGLPDLSSVDFTKNEQFQDWHDQHRNLHTLISANLGV